MLRGRETLIGNLAVGDIFHAECDDMDLICLVTDLTGETIKGRTVTQQMTIEILRDSGKGVCRWAGNVRDCTIISVAPLPNDIHDTLLGIDRKMRLEADPARMNLSRDETRALLFLDAHYAENRFAPSAGGANDNGANSPAPR